MGKGDLSLGDFKRMLDQGSRPDGRNERKPATFSRLKDLFNRFKEIETFEPGDELVWKEGMKNRRIPEYDESIIFIQNKKVENTNKETGDAYFTENLDCELGTTIDDEFVIYAFDSRRFTHANAKSKKK